jgi:hypothetical protein
MWKGVLSLGVLAAGLAAAPLSGWAADSPAPPASPATPAISFELNKLETHEGGCRAYIVVDNPTSATFQSFNMELYFFGQDGIINGQVLFNFAPIRAHARNVKGLYLEHLPCDAIATILANDVLECKVDNVANSDCLSLLTVSSRAAAKFTK